MHPTFDDVVITIGVFTDYDEIKKVKLYTSSEVEKENFSEKSGNSYGNEDKGSDTSKSDVMNHSDIDVDISEGDIDDNDGISSIPKPRETNVMRSSIILKPG
jgi:hypothetical protein